MKNQKSNKLLVVLLVIFIILTLVLGGFIVYNKLFSKSNSIDNIVIENTEVKELYNYVQASLNSNSVCLGYFYQNPFKNHTLEDKISLVLINYASKREKKIDDNFLQKLSKNDRDLVNGMGGHYVDAEVVKEGMKLIFNIDISTNNFKNYSNYGTWRYISDDNAFVSGDGGGNYESEIIQQIIEYNELNDEINFTVVKAELSYDNNIYRYVNNTNTLVFENVNDNFEFTKENVNKFPQLKYIFKKNTDGKYYVSDIINLNFEEDFVNCN